MIESDDWGLCGWSPDEPAWRALAELPAFRSPPGRRYGGSTLERAEDVRELARLLAELRGGDGFAPVLQANTVMAGPAFERLTPPAFDVAELPVTESYAASARWRRDGLAAAVDTAIEAGVWWPELHGLHHVPEHAWLTALRRGVDDARRALEHHSTICTAVEASGEYDPSEPRELRRRHIGRAVERFARRFGRPPGSLCPPDYRWDDALEADAEALGLTTLQGLAEQSGHPLARLRRLALRHRWPNRRGGRFYLPPRIAFEPGAWEPDARGSLVESTRRRVRAAWDRGQPAILSTHRVNYVHLDPERARRGRDTLRDLLSRLVEDGAAFLTDAEVRQLEERSWSARAIGSAAVIIRSYGVGGEPIRVRAPAGAAGASIREGRGMVEPLRLEDCTLVARLEPGEYRVQWD